MSTVAFFAYGWDKSAARRGDRRTPESTLHLMGMVGGWPGGLAAQRVLRHKSCKQEFLAFFWFTVFLNVAFVAYLVWRGDTERVSKPVFLAGGLRESNVAEAIASVDPFGIDPCSSVREGGMLCVEKLAGFMGAVHAAPRRRSRCGRKA